jgi:hypothetical protein
VTTTRRSAKTTTQEKGTAAAARKVRALVSGRHATDIDPQGKSPPNGYYQCYVYAGGIGEPCR